MSTKKYGWSSLKRHCLSNQSETDKNNSNFILNQSSECQIHLSQPVQLYSMPKNVKNIGFTSISLQKDKSSSFSKTITSKNLFINNEIKEEESLKSWKNDSKNSNAKNGSTLSLHIAAYENSVEAASNESEDFSKKSKIFKSAVSSLKNNQASFEFPRQMDGNNPSESEVQQFKASQKLLSPKQNPSKSSPSPACADENNNNNNNDSNKENLVSTCPSNTVATTTTNKNLTVTDTVSETEPLMKVVVSPQRGPVELLDSTDASSADEAPIIHNDASLAKDEDSEASLNSVKEHSSNTSQNLPVTPPTSRRTEIDGRPITWAPKQNYGKIRRIFRYG